MSSTPPSFDEYLAEISSEAVRLAAVTIETLDEAVPSCPGWTGRDLVDHVTDVFSFWNTQVLAADETRRVELGDHSSPSEGEPGEWLEQAAEDLLEALRSAGPESPCWNWAGRDTTSSWVARRMALQAAVHRFDGELTAGEPTSIDARLSADGIDEFLTVYLRADLPDVPTATLGGSLCLACTDTDDAWIVEIGGGRLRVRNDRGPAAACLRGTASDVFLFVWNRLGPDDLELTGDRAVAAAWADLPH
jgi:uncharacterized protein (TIGR03083 family)